MNMEAGHNDGEGGCTQIHRGICATGTMWGVLKDAPFWKLALWWLVRHAIYGSVIAAIIISEPPAIVYQILGVFIMVIHSYKLWRYLSADDSLKEVEEDPHVLKKLAVVTAEPSYYKSQFVDASPRNTV